MPKGPHRDVVHPLRQLRRVDHLSIGAGSAEKERRVLRQKLLEPRLEARRMIDPTEVVRIGEARVDPEQGPVIGVRIERIGLGRLKLNLEGVGSNDRHGRQPAFGLRDRRAVGRTDAVDIGERQCAARGRRTVHDIAAAVKHAVDVSVVRNLQKQVPGGVRIRQSPLCIHNQHIRHIAVRIDHRVGRVAGQLLQPRARGKGGRDVPRLDTGTFPVVHGDEQVVHRRGPPREHEHVCDRLVHRIGVVDLDELAASVFVPDLHQPRDVRIPQAQRVGAAVVPWKVDARWSELKRVVIDDRRAVASQDIGEGDRVVFGAGHGVVVAVHMMDADRAVVLPVIPVVKRRTDDVRPRAEAIRADQVPQRAALIDVQRIPIAELPSLRRPARPGARHPRLANPVLRRRPAAFHDLHERVRNIGRAVEPRVSHPDPGVPVFVPEVRRRVLGGVQAEPVHADVLEHPLRRPHQQPQRRLGHRIARHRVRRVERMDRKTQRPRVPRRARIDDRQRRKRRVGIEPRIRRIGLIVQRAGRDVVRIARGRRLADELMVLVLVDVDQPDQATREQVETTTTRIRRLGASAGKRMEIAERIDARNIEYESRIASLADKAGGIVVTCRVVVHDPVHEHLHVGTVVLADQKPQSGLGPVARRRIDRPEVKSVKRVIADVARTGAGPDRRRQPDPAVSGHENVRHPMPHDVPLGLEVLQQGAVGLSQARSRRRQYGDHSHRDFDPASHGISLTHLQHPTAKTTARKPRFERTAPAQPPTRTGSADAIDTLRYGQTP